MTETATLERAVDAPLTPESPPLLAIRGIRKGFPGVVALDGVSFTLKAGTVHALMGENGAGKSTLLKILAGAQPPSSGRVILDGAKTVRISGKDVTVRAQISHSASRASMNSVIPATRACSSRFSTSHSRQERSASFFLPAPPSCVLPQEASSCRPW